MERAESLREIALDMIPPVAHFEFLAAGQKCREPQTRKSSPPRKRIIFLRAIPGADPELAGKWTPPHYSVLPLEVRGDGSVVVKFPLAPRGHDALEGGWGGAAATAEDAEAAAVLECYIK